MNTIDLTKLRNAEYLQYTKDFAAIINLNNPSTLNIDAKFTAFNTKIAELESFYKKALASEKTKDIMALDQMRDDAINGVYYFLLGYSYHYDEQQRQNAQLLLTNLSLYGSGIARMNYQAETATINNILRDWENKTELEAAVGGVNLTAWVRELKTANDAFNEQYLLRTQEYGDANPETIRTKREETSSAFYALRDRIDALHLLSEISPSPHSAVINQLNALTDQYNQLLVNRKPETEELPDNEKQNGI